MRYLTYIIVIFQILGCSQTETNSRNNETQEHKQLFKQYKSAKELAETMPEKELLMKYLHKIKNSLTTIEILTYCDSLNLKAKMNVIPVQENNINQISLINLKSYIFTSFSKNVLFDTFFHHNIVDLKVIVPNNKVKKGGKLKTYFHPVSFNSRTSQVLHLIYSNKTDTIGSIHNLDSGIVMLDANDLGHNTVIYQYQWYNFKNTQIIMSDTIHYTVE